MPFKACYLMHNECWGLFKIVALRLGVEESELPFYQNYLYRALSVAPYNPNGIIWPHCYNLLPEEALIYRRFHSGSHASYIDPHGLDHVGYSELQAAAPRVYYTQPPTHQDILADSASIDIPDFLPLPVELTHKVLCYLPGTDIITLSGIKSSATLQVPDFVWKAQFDLGAELGYLIQPHYMIALVEATWRAKYLFTKKILSENYKAAENLKRRWSLFSGLVHKLRDTEDCEEANLCDPESEYTSYLYKRDRDQSLVCQGLPQAQIVVNGNYHCDGVQIRAGGSLRDVTATAMYVSFIGEGKLRFVSGLRFLPGGERLGLINSQDEEFIQLNTPSSSIRVIWVATSNYGIRSISVAPVGIDYTFQNFNDVYVSRKMLRTKPDGIKISRLDITVGLSELSGLYMDSPDFISTKNLDLQEWFIQRYTWSPTIPPISSKQPIEISIDHYSFCGHLNYAAGQAIYETAVLEYVAFAEKKVSRITCWLKSTHSLEICGIGMLLEGCDTPYIMGTKTELSTDAVLESGETILEIELFVGRNDCSHAGLSVRTDRGIPFYFALADTPYTPQKHTLGANSGDEIVGLFAGFNKPLSGIQPCQLLALGVITSKARSRIAESEVISEKHPSNPQLRHWDEARDGICPKDILPHNRAYPRKPPYQQSPVYFISTAPLGNCKSLECYIEDNQYGYRITGICVTYGKEADTPQRKSAVLGRLSGASTKAVFEIQSDQGEYIMAADIYIRKVDLPGLFSGGSFTRPEPSEQQEAKLIVVGVVFWTSSRRKVSCGKCQAQYATKVVPLRTSIEDDLILKWIYTENIDYLVNERRN
ncbi:hypothetical protein TWF730_006185 [Orbilia blumenaviensis]